MVWSTLGSRTAKEQNRTSKNDTSSRLARQTVTRGDAAVGQITSDTYFCRALPHFVFHLVERIADEVDGLEVLVVVLLQGGGGRVEVEQLRPVRESVLQFAVSRQQTGAVRAQLTVLLAQPELHREPVQLQHAQSTPQRLAGTQPELHGEPVQLQHAQNTSHSVTLT